jgi:hypothetical protein
MAKKEKVRWKKGTDKDDRKKKSTVKVVSN